MIHLIKLSQSIQFIVKTRTQIWAELLRKLAAEGEPIMMRMTMKNGAEFDRLLPPQEAIGDETFHPEYEWPFVYDEIVGIDIYDRLSPRIFPIAHDFEAIDKIVGSIQGADHRNIYRIFVPPAD